LARQVDQVCDRFEAAWKAGQRPRIEDYLGNLHEPEHPDLLRGLLVLELAYRRQAGERPTPGAYRARFPEHTELIDSLCAAAPSPTTASWSAAEAATGRIGPYKLLQPLGEGGMGTVFMAEQEQPIRRRVALKIIKPGMDSAQVIARFEAERQALALMDHPNIARVLDAGTTEAGRPYFVMDLVRGVPITEYCDQNRLAPAQRLELFMPVCQAIQHAHQKGIIHRDIKPSNVLVSLQDGKPVSKVIDFGIAKAIEQRLTERTLFTQFGAVIGTPEYMSPEQAGMSGLDVDTRSDIYSLGVLLYELLTGSTPLRRETLRQAGFDEILRRIRDEGPPRPSTRLSQSTDTLPSISAQRQTEPARLRKLVRGELDWIVMKALEKDRTRRYETASGLARDIERYLHDEPVEAGPPSRAYKLKKYALKHRVGLATASAFAGMLILGTVISTVAAIRAIRAEAQAEVNLAKAQGEEKKARKSESEAQAQTRLATDRAEDLVWEDYINRVNRAYREIQDDNIELAENLLHGCPPQRRGWEWHYVKRLAHLDRLTLESGSPSAEAVAYSPDGKWIATSAGEPRYGGLGGEPSVHICEVATGTRRRTLRGLKGIIVGLVFSPDGSRIVACSRVPGAFSGRSQLIVWDAATGETLWSVSETDDETPPGKEPRAVWSVAFTPDGRGLAVGYGSYNSQNAGYAKVWDVATGRELFRLPGPAGGVLALAIHPDGQRLALTGSEVVELWDMRSRKKVREFRGHTRWVMCVALSPDGARLASAGWDQAIRIWTVETGALERTLFGHEGFIRSLAFGPDGARLASASEDGSTRLWDVLTGRPVAAQHGHVGFVHAVAVRPDGREIASGGDDGTTKLWDLRTCAPIVFDRHRGWVERLAIRRDGRRVFSETGTLRIEADPTRVWDPATGEDDPKLTGVPLEALGPEFVPGVGSGNFAATSPDGRLVALLAGPKHRAVAQSGGTTVEVRERASGQLRFTLVGHSSNISCLIFSPDGRRLATASDDRRIKLWDVTTGREVFTLRGHTGGVHSLAFSPDGNRIVSGAIEGTARVWDGAPLPDEILQAHETRFQQKLKRIGELGQETDELNRAEVLAMSGQLARAADLLRQAVERRPDDLQLRLRWADLLARDGQWDLAASAFAKAVTAQPGALGLWRLHLLALLSSGNFDGYRGAVKDLIGRFGATTNPAEANNVAWFCTWAPNALDDLNAPVRLAETAMSRYPESRRQDLLDTLGAVLYRAGRFEEAVKRLDESVQAGKRGGAPEDWAYLAMAHHRLGHGEEAHRWLEKLRAYKPPDASGYFWHTVEIDILRRDTEKLIGESQAGAGQGS
jgi:WD40 repeat protein/serine/threonine protein kinase